MSSKDFDFLFLTITGITPAIIVFPEKRFVQNVPLFQDESNHVLTTNIWLALEWLDPRLRWEPALANGTNKLHVKQRLIWRPNLRLYNK